MTIELLRLRPLMTLKRHLSRHTLDLVLHILGHREGLLVALGGDGVVGVGGVSLAGGVCLGDLSTNANFFLFRHHLALIFRSPYSGLELKLTNILIILATPNLR